jgi:hypothetical protein
MLLVLALALGACTTPEDGAGNGNDGPPGTTPLSKQEFHELASEIQADVEAAAASMTGSNALSAVAGLVFSGVPYSNDPAWQGRLPRGEWRFVDWFDGGWEHLGSLPGGLLRYVWPAQSEGSGDLEVEIDWEHEGAPTQIFSSGDYTTELPRHMKADVALSGSSVLDAEAVLSYREQGGVCEYDGHTFDSDAIHVASLLLKGRLGDATHFLRAVDPIRFSQTSSGATSSGNLELVLGSEKATLEWNLNATGQLLDHCDAFGEMSMSGTVKASFAGHDVGLALRLSSNAESAILNVSEFIVVIDGRSFSISGQLDFEAADPLADMVIEFSDGTMPLADFFGIEVSPLF